jgi:hypothetical protein
VDADENRQCLLLALREVEGHAGEVQFEQALLPVLDEFEIVRKIGAIIGDNAGTNQTLCSAFSNYLKLEYPKDPEWITSTQRIRCLRHIINLIVQSFLFLEPDHLQDMASYDQDDQIEEELEEDEQVEKARERGKKMREKLGALGKLHNIIVHIRASPQRTKSFETQAGRRIPLENCTRWNSWFQMLDAIFKDPKKMEVEIAISHYYQEHSESLPFDALDTRDWSLLRTIYEYLSVFNSATLIGEGYEATLHFTYMNLDIIHTFLQKHKVWILNFSFLKI